MNRKNCKKQKEMLENLHLSFENACWPLTGHWVESHYLKLSENMLPDNSETHRADQKGGIWKKEGSTEKNEKTSSWVST